MAITKAMLQTPLRNIGLSHELILLLEDCDFATVGDYWLHDTRLLQSKYYSPALYTECLHEITRWLAEQILNEQRMLKQQRIQKRKKKKNDYFRWLRCLLRSS